MSDGKPMEVLGTVEQVLGNNNFRVLVQLEGKESPIPVLCYLSGKMRQMFKISVVAGDTVRVQIAPPYDRGRIVYREK